MKFEFVDITIQNFMSFGNNPTTIELNKHNTTSIIAKNGYGKTTLGIEAARFALTGKLLRKHLKGQVVNSINQKNCLVTLNFKLDGKPGSIVRGISPDVFDVEFDGNPLFNDVSRLQKQASLEDFTGFTTDIFDNVAVISEDSESFMNMDGPTRRQFVEKVLNLTFFDDIHREVKTVVKNLKPKLADAESKVREKKAILDRLIETRADQSGDYDSKKSEELKDRIDKGKAVVSRMEDKLRDLNIASSDLSDEYSNFRSSQDQIGREIEKTERSLTDVKSGKCPECGSKYPKEKAKDIKEKLEELKKSLDPIKLKELREKSDEADLEYEDFKAKLQTAKNKLFDVEREYHENEKMKPSDTIDKQILEVEAEYTEAFLEKEVIEEEMADAVEVDKVLKSGTAKAPIISEYIPFFNKRVNEYLEVLDLPLLLEIDSEFKEKYRSRFRENFTYSMYSTGQKQRMDFAILLTWRDISKKISSIDTNLLVVDEFAARLDDEGAKSVVKMLSDIEDTNVVCIAPRKIDAEFDRKIEIDMVSNFSVINVE